MAQGSFVAFEEFRLNIGNGAHNLASDAFSILLTSSTPTAADLTPDSADYAEVSGSGYTAGGGTATVTYTEAGGTATFALASPVAWTQNGAGPSNIRYGIVYNTTHAGTNDAVGFIDMTADAGTTPISLINGNITIGAGTLFTLA